MLSYSHYNESDSPPIRRGNGTIRRIYLNGIIPKSKVSESSTTHLAGAYPARRALGLICERRNYR